MFSICIKNSCLDYIVFLDGEELPLDYSNGTSKYVSLSNKKGQHTLRIKKDKQEIKVSQIALFWISTFLTSYDEAMVSLYRSAKEIDIEYCIDASEDFEFVFNAYKNEVVSCSDNVMLMQNSSTEDTNIKSKLKFYVKLPFMLLTTIILIPLWVLSALMMIASVDLIAILLFAMLSVLIVLALISWLRNKKNGW